MLGAELRLSPYLARLAICGNGGSGANASHFCEDLGKGTLKSPDDEKRLKVMSLTDNTSYILAWANDAGFDRVFVEQLKNFALPADVLIAISGSGDSPNVLEALRWARDKGLHTWAVTGRNGGEAGRIAENSVNVPCDDMGMIESIHSVLFHWIVGDVFARIHRKGRYAVGEYLE